RTTAAGPARPCWTPSCPTVPPPSSGWPRRTHVRGASTSATASFPTVPASATRCSTSPRCDWCAERLARPRSADPRRALRGPARELVHLVQPGEPELADDPDAGLRGEEERADQEADRSCGLRLLGEEQDAADDEQEGSEDVGDRVQDLEHRVATSLLRGDVTVSGVEESHSVSWQVERAGRSACQVTSRPAAGAGRAVRRAGAAGSSAARGRGAAPRSVPGGGSRS